MFRNTWMYLIILFSSYSFADSTIRINVKTDERTAAAIGFSVDGKKSGSRGKVHTGKGPVNRQYTFGFRKHFALGPDVLCGSKILTKDSVVNLVTQGEKCFLVVK